MNLMLKHATAAESGDEFPVKPACSPFCLASFRLGDCALKPRPPAISRTVSCFGRLPSARFAGVLFSTPGHQVAKPPRKGAAGNGGSSQTWALPARERMGFSVKPMRSGASNQSNPCFLHKTLRESSLYNTAFTGRHSPSK